MTTITEDIVAILPKKRTYIKVYVATGERVDDDNTIIDGLSLCPHCHCMTWTLPNDACGKCGGGKVE